VSTYSTSHFLLKKHVPCIVIHFEAQHKHSKKERKYKKIKKKNTRVRRIY
jgi:hypothetical protein